MSEQIIKPPIGLVPQWRWKEWRIDEIDQAITRYKAARFIIPTDWLIERNELVIWLKENLPNSPYAEVKKSKTNAKGQNERKGVSGISENQGSSSGEKTEREIDPRIQKRRFNPALRKRGK